MLTDTHTHLYLPEFGESRQAVMERALEQGVRRFFLPNIDSASVAPLYALCENYPEHCFPMLGLHPCSVKADFREELERIEQELNERPCYAIGEIGIDLYWDKSLFRQQEEAFRIQLRWAVERDLPIVIHSRESFEEIYSILLEERHPRLRGIFHCFTGSHEQAVRAIELGFLLGIGGVVTFRNSELDRVVAMLSLDHIVLETDSPYLAPVPFRGKRNESAYLVHIARKVAEIYGLPEEEIARRTSANASRVFGI